MDWIQIQKKTSSRRRLLNDILEWDVLSWAPCLDFWAAVMACCGPNVLTVGERNGGISLWFALQGFKVTCTDRNGPTQRARELHQEHNIGHQVTYTESNVFALPFPDASFDIVACKSVIGGLKLQYADAATRTLENQTRAIQEIHRVLKPGGYFFGAENMAATWFHQKMRRWVKRGRVGWRHPTRKEIDLLFACFEIVEQQPHGFLGSKFSKLGLDRLSVAIDAWACPLLPADWQYISYIRARKQGASRAVLTADV